MQLVMTRRQCLNAVALACLPVAAGSAAGATKTSSGETKPRSGAPKPEAVVAAFTSAWNEHRVDNLVRLFTPDGRLKTPAGEGAQSRPGIRRLLVKQHGEVFRESTLHTTVQDVKHHGAARATVTGTFTLDGIPVALGIEVSREGSFTFALTRRDGKWLIRSARISTG